MVEAFADRSLPGESGGHERAGADPIDNEPLAAEPIPGRDNRVVGHLEALGQLAA